MSDLSRENSEGCSIPPETVNAGRRFSDKTYTTCPYYIDHNRRMDSLELHIREQLKEIKEAIRPIHSIQHISDRFEKIEENTKEIVNLKIDITKNSLDNEDLRNNIISLKCEMDKHKNFDIRALIGTISIMSLIIGYLLLRVVEHISFK